MSAAWTDVLIVEGDPAAAGSIREALTGREDSRFRIEWATRLGDALVRLRAAAVDVVLLDLTLPDGHGVKAFDRVIEAAPDALILALAAAKDEGMALLAVQRGAHDYFLKEHIDAHWLPRALRSLMERKASQDALRASEARFRAMSDASPLGIFVSDAGDCCVYCNAAYREISGLGVAETLGTDWTIAIHPEDRPSAMAGWRHAARRREPFQGELRFLRKDGCAVWTRVNSAPLDDGLEAHGRVTTVEDISDRKSAELVLQSAEEALFEEKEHAQVTLGAIGDAVMTTDRQGKLTYLNPAAETLTGWSREEAMGRPLAEVFKVVDATACQATADAAQRAIAEERPVAPAADCVLVRRDGFESEIEDSAALIHDREGQVAGAVIVFHDVSASRAMASKMSHLAQHDFLTDLPNRVLLTERLSRAIGLALRHRKQGALLFLDLDNFKHINDSLGHALGDQLLRAVADRLVACARATDTVCRQGGDEFVILLAEIERTQDAAYVAEKLLAACAVPHLIEGNELHVTSSIGISIYPDDGIEPDTLLQCADTAMYQAKESGRNNYQFFKSEMNTRAVRRMFIENSLRRALKHDEFVLHYQPQIDLATGAMTGMEALIRWQYPERGLVHPEQFVPIAEESGLIVPIGRWVLREACRQVKEWLDSGLRVVPVAVNISAVEFRYKGFLEGVALILKETGLAPRYLELELTESILMHDAEASASLLDELKAMGLQLAIDDFGTGYSSLSYLKRFPIDTLKIDQSFVRDVTTDADDATIVSAVIGMGKNLKQRVIAEGVETLEQVAFLRTQNCAEGQGFRFSHPLSAEDLARLLAAGDPQQGESGQAIR